MDQIEAWSSSVTCCDPVWEQAYRRFESSQAEVAKFVRRLERLGATGISRDAAVVDLFCGRGNGLVALEQLGFRNLEGVDLSRELLSTYNGSATVYVGDCRELRFENATKDVVCIQGGLHHLPTLMADLELVLSEVHRVLKDSGVLLLVEPWPTPFLSFVHWCCRRRMLRRAWPRLDALAAMIDSEQTTYFNWLEQPEEIGEAIRRRFQPEYSRIALGKLMIRARKRA